MEEFVGKIWDSFITKSANRHYPEAIVHLDEIRRTAGIFFRALGGEAGLRVENATDSEIHARRSLLQRIAGTGKKTPAPAKKPNTPGAMKKPCACLTASHCFPAKNSTAIFTSG